MQPSSSSELRDLGVRRAIGELTQQRGPAEPTLNVLFLSTYIQEFPSSPEEALKRLRNEGSRQVCQYQFKKNDIVWICKSCQRDETCVLCNACFPFSNHEGHEVFFYHSQAGGCCDCGDPGAWDPIGFCHRHGKVHENPMKDLPRPILSSGKLVLETIAEYVEAYMMFHASQFDLTLFLSPPVGHRKVDRFCLVLAADDIHTQAQIEAFLASTGLPMPAYDRNEKLRKLNENSEAPIFSESFEEISACLLRLKAAGDLDSWSLYCTLEHGSTSIGDQFWYNASCSHEFVVDAFSWLYKLAEVSDGMCSLICSTFHVERLKNMLEASSRSPAHVIKPFHGLLLMLMADISFKRVVAAAYALALPKAAVLHGSGVGKSDNSIFRLSVQFLNRYEFVSEIVDKYQFLENLANSLLLMMLSAKRARKDSAGSIQRSGQLKHHVIKNRRYDAVMGDMKIIFILPDIPKRFCKNCLDTLLAAVDTVQYIDPQTRQVASHVEYENDNWICAFNMQLSFASLFESLIGWFGSDGKGVEGPFCTEDVLLSIVRATYSWHQTRPSRDGEHPVSLSSRDPIGVFNRPPTDFSFHIIFHRFLSSCIKECCRFPQHVQTLFQLSRLLGTSTSVNDMFRPSSDYDKGDNRGPSSDGRPLWWFYAIADYPLLNLVTASQIKLKMWARNGTCMLDQLLNYNEYPFCRIFRDFDLLLLQFCGVVVGSRIFLQHIFNRYNVHSLLANKRFDLSHTDPPKARQLLDEALHSIIVLVTELPLPPVGVQSSPVDDAMSLITDDTMALNIKLESGERSQKASSSEGINEVARNRSILRREVLHRLMAASSSTYSQLYECRTFVPGQDKNCDHIIDSIVEDVAVVKSSGGMEDSVKIYLRPEYWSEYDPCFYHLSVAQHQNTHEQKPRVKTPTAICPSPPISHEVFLPLRHTVLFDPLLLGYIRDLLYSFVALRFEKELEEKMPPPPTASAAAARAPHGLAKDSVEGTVTERSDELNVARKRAFLSVVVVTKPWVLQCTDTTFLKCVQLLTLLIHHLEHLKTMNSARADADIKKLTDFLLHAPHTYVPPPLAAFLDSASEDRAVSTASITSLIQQRLSALSSPGMSGANTPYPMSGLNSIYGSTVNSNNNSGRNSRSHSIDGLESIISGSSTVFDYAQPAHVTGINVNFAPMSSGQINGVIADSYLTPSVISSFDYSSEVVLPLPSLLGVVLMVHDLLHCDDDGDHKNYIRWCLDRLRVLLPVCDRIIVDWMRTQLDNERNVFMKAKKIEAREKITLRMQAMVASFMDSPEYKLLSGRGGNSSSASAHSVQMNDMDNEDVAKISGVKRSDAGEELNEGTQCIICHSHSESLGRLSHLVLAQTVKQQSYNQCINLHTEVDKDGVTRSEGGEPMDADSGAAKESRYSPSRLLLRFCGHAMHQKCFEGFYPQVVLRSNIQQGLLLETDKGEFQCPLCKMLNNSVVPIVSNLSKKRDLNAYAKDPRKLKQAKHDGGDAMSVVEDRATVPDDDSVVSDFLVNWIRNSPRLLREYSDSASVRVLAKPELAAVYAGSELPLAHPDIAKQSAAAAVGRPRTSSWISRAFSSFPLKLFNNESVFSETKDLDDSNVEVGISAQFMLPRPEDISNVLEENLLSRQSEWTRFLAEITDSFFKIPVGVMKECHVLNAVAYMLNSVACTISVEATEFYPGHHLLKKESIGIDQLKAIRDVTDILGHCIHDFHTAKGVHRCLMTALTGDPVNVLWMADNSIPLSDSLSVARSCVEETMRFATREGWPSEPLVLTTRRAVQLYGSVTKDGSNRFSDLFLQPLLARPLLDSITLVVALHRTHGSGASNGETETQSTVAKVSSDRTVTPLAPDDAFMATCKWLMLARLVQLIAIAVAKNKHSSESDFTPIPKIGTPLEDLVRELYSIGFLFIEGKVKHQDDLKHFDLTGMSRINADDIESIIFDWIVFLRCVLQLLLRCNGDSSGRLASRRHNIFNTNIATPTEEMSYLLDLQQDLVSPISPEAKYTHLAAVDLLEILDLPRGERDEETPVLKECLKQMSVKWLCALGTADHVMSASSMFTMSNLRGPLQNLVRSGRVAEIFYRPEAAISDDTRVVRDLFVDNGFLRYSNLVMEKSNFLHELGSEPPSLGPTLVSHNAACLAARLGVLDIQDVPSASPLRNLLQPFRKFKLYEFPESYTMLHQKIRSLCDYEYPAICLTCGLVLNGGGKGLCTQHVSTCSGDAGAFFLLQDCQILCMYHSRASYFPAPFVDDHGEKHRHFRGKPLHLDHKRYEILRSLVANGGIANEVVQKRSISQRVIIAHHY